MPTAATSSRRRVVAWSFLRLVRTARSMPSAWQAASMKAAGVEPGALDAGAAPLQVDVGPSLLGLQLTVSAPPGELEPGGGPGVGFYRGLQPLHVGAASSTERLCEPVQRLVDVYKGILDLAKQLAVP